MVYMKNIVVVTNFLPHYQIDFFNRLVSISNDINLTVFADVSSDSALNNFNDFKCNFNVIDSPVKYFKGLMFRASLRKQINNIDPDALVFYGNPREVYLTALMFFYRMTGRSFYVHGMFHRIGGQTLFSKLYYRFIGLIASKCFTYSRKGAEVLLGLGVRHSKVEIVGTAIDEKKSMHYASKITNEKLIDFKKANGVLNKKIVLQVVRLSKIKKPDMILSVAEEIKKSRSDIIFVLIGGGEMYDEMRSKVKELGLESIVLMLGPIYDEEVLSYWFRSAKVFVMPTCIGLSAHHAFSYSLPIVTDDDLLEQASEFDILTDGLNSLIYESGNIGSFREKILKIVDDDGLQVFLSKNALHTVSHTYSLDSKCKKYLNFLGCMPGV